MCFTGSSEAAGHSYKYCGVLFTLGPSNEAKEIDFWKAIKRSLTQVSSLMNVDMDVHPPPLCGEKRGVYLRPGGSLLELF